MCFKKKRNWAKGISLKKDSQLSIAAMSDQHTKFLIIFQNKKTWLTLFQQICSHAILWLILGILFNHFKCICLRFLDITLIYARSISYMYICLLIYLYSHALSFWTSAVWMSVCFICGTSCIIHYLYLQDVHVTVWYNHAIFIGKI